MKEEKATLLLKWGSIKGWSGMSPEQVAILQKWSDGGVSMSAMLQDDSSAQKEAILELIETMEDGQIINDWSGEPMTKEEAKDYVATYGKKA